MMTPHLPQSTGYAPFFVLSTRPASRWSFAASIACSSPNVQRLSFQSGNCSKVEPGLGADEAVDTFCILRPVDQTVFRQELWYDTLLRFFLQLQLQYAFSKLWHFVT